MAKVIVERPRYGSRLGSKGKGYQRRATRLAWEDQPKREGMKLRGGRGKALNEHLSPLRRYLAGQVGRPWDKIFADICRYLDRNSAVQDHVRDHLSDYVAIRVIVHNGQLCHGDGYRIGTPLYTLFYVCPRTGILKKNGRPRRFYFRRPDKLQVHFVGPGKALVRHAGAWHWIAWQEIPQRDHSSTTVYPRRWDALLGYELSRDVAVRVYGRPIHAVSAHRARKRDVRGVVNSYPYPNLVR